MVEEEEGEEEKEGRRGEEMSKPKCFTEKLHQMFKKNKINSV